MELLPIRTPLLKAGDDLATILMENADIQSGDIIAISSKAIATIENAAIDLSHLIISDEAKMWSEKTRRSAAFIQAVINETIRLNGKIIGDCPGALLTDLRPEGLYTGTILAPNAGLDESNIAKGKAIGWPVDAVNSAGLIKEALESYGKLQVTHSGLRASELRTASFKFQEPANMQPANLKLGVIITDSCCRPRRLGVTAFALTVAGFDPLKSEVGSMDLFNRELRVTVEATADQLATAANAVMGNAGQSTPAVIIRGHGIIPSDFCGWVGGIEPEEDLFRSILSL